jgi:predicted O-methyltransferase YrrM
MPRKRRHHGQPRALPVRVALREDGSRALEIGGVTQSVSVPDDEPVVDGEPQPGPRGGYWGLMLPPGCPRRALLLGLGGGAVATLLARRCPDVAITGVERDPTVIAIARQEFGLDALPHLTIVEADAFVWMEACAGDPQLISDDEPRERYNLICVDLFEAGRLAMGTLTTRFLRQIAALLTPGGVATINLMVTGRTNEQVHRIERVFTIQRNLRTRGNLILHLTPLGSRLMDGMRV